MKIDKWNDECIWFSDGSTITYDHDHDCCEYNYADFSVLDIFYNGETFLDYRLEPVKYGVNLVLIGGESYVGASWYGWDSHHKAIYIPFYSDQNGYYTSDLCLVIEGKSTLIVGPCSSFLKLDHYLPDEEIEKLLEDEDLKYKSLIFCKVCEDVLVCETVRDAVKILADHMQDRAWKHVKTTFDPVTGKREKKHQDVRAEKLASDKYRVCYVIDVDPEEVARR